MTKRDPDERVSMHGLDPEEALRALLAVRPEGEATERDDDEDGGKHGEPSHPTR